MENENMTFRKGTYELHPDANFNYQLNRMVMWSGADLDEVRETARKISDMSSWVAEFLALGEKALQEGRVENAIAYLRGAEFFMYDDIEEKIRVFDKATDLFYDHYSHIFAEGIIARERLPYTSGYLPVWVARPEENGGAGTILAHGGFDSCMEEFLAAVLYLREKDYTVYLFEGPGQGEVLRKCGIPFTYAWEKPVQAILDHYALDDVTIMGLSLGGMLAPRAAAFEPRIKRVVAWGILTNFLDVVISTRPQALQRLMKVALRLRLQPLVNLAAKGEMARDPLAEWGIKHGSYAFGVRSPYHYLAMTGRFQLLDIADLITQDFLLLGATKDHFIPLDFYKDEIDCLKNVRSLTFRLFTAQEQAENHCNAGNTRLALDTITAWIAEMTP
jgi:pimeloyl-ACP methyl ester carboxylesterase